MADAARHLDGGRQLGLYEGTQRAERKRAPRTPDAPQRPVREPGLCAGCRAAEARYGFRVDGDDNALVERPRTLCFACFRREIDRRQLVATRLARRRDAQQAQPSLEEKLRTLSLRRRRAQIAARKALEADLC